jgi:hypothetical protein
MKSLLLAIVALSVLSVSALEKIGTLVSVSPDGQINPPGAVAAITDLAQAAAVAAAASARADAAEAAAVALSNRLANVMALIASQQANGYVRGFITSYEGGAAPNTNIIASILKILPAGTDATYSYWDLFTYFTEDPGVLPSVRSNSANGRSNAWEVATSVSVTLTNTVFDSVEYACYANRVRMPVEVSTAFFIVNADVGTGGGDGQRLPINNGFKINGRTGITVRLVDGTNVLNIVGGGVVQ